MIKRSLLTAGCFWLMTAGLIAIAQQKQLSTSQYWKNDRQGLENPLPRFVGWQDDTHYLLVPSGRRDTVVVDVKTGQQQSFTQTKQMNAVFVRENDLFYLSATGEIKQLTHDRDEEKNPTLSPDGLKVAYTKNNDLYVIDIAGSKETRLTQDGSDVIYNGWASWVYFEEILGRPSKYKAFWWSPDSKNIAYMHFDDSQVPMVPLVGSKGQHGYMEKTRYPKAGDRNPEVKMGFANIETGKTVWSDFNEKDDQYFGTPFWAPDGKTLWMQWMNRRQKQLIVYAVNASDGTKKPVYEEQQKTWVDWLDDIYFLANNKGYIIQSDKSGWMHIYWYSMDGKLIRQITDGNWAVNDLLSIRENNNTIYFTARKENSTRYDFYSIKMDGKDLKRLSFGDFTNTIELSPSANYFITSYSNTHTPPKMALIDTKGKLIREIADSRGKDLDQYQLASTEIIRVKTPDGFDLPLTITWPANMDSTKKYPVLISIYGGPNAGTVYDGWNWRSFGNTQWWAKEGLIQVAIDHRGSGQFGKMGQNYLYRNLGSWEIKDYSEVVKWLTAKPFINKDKIGITGFSYGGYITCMALTKGAEYFKYGIAGGSVTSWYLYDTHYTERFMDLPSENPLGYDTSSVMKYVKNYTGDLYIVHGEMDDNVHMQNSLQLVGALQDEKKVFEMMIYPGGRHGWGNLPGKWNHFNNEKTRYYYKNLLEKPVPAEALQ